MTTFKRLPRDTDKPPSLRVNIYGLIEVLVDADVTWGLHNTRLWTDRVSPGFLFNSLDMIGSWYDIDPRRTRPDSRYYRRVGDAIAATEVDKRNRQNGIRTWRIYESKSL